MLGIRLIREPVVRMLQADRESSFANFANHATRADPQRRPGQDRAPTYRVAQSGVAPQGCTQAAPSVIALWLANARDV